MSSTLAYLTSRADFAQVSSDIPVTKTRNAEKVDSEEVFNGVFRPLPHPIYHRLTWVGVGHIANKKELVADLMMKAKQVEYLIQSLPAPEPEEEQVEFCVHIPVHPIHQAYS